MKKEHKIINHKINVTKTWLPEKEKLYRYIDQIYESDRITNNGPMVQELTKRLQDYLGVKNLLLVTNGTLALQVAYRVLGIEIAAVTTPFTFAATSSSLVWEGIKVQFADIDKRTFCIDPEKIIRTISEDTSGIVPVHVFGNACEIERIDDIAIKKDLKVVYDGSHAFGVRYKGKSILSYGNATTLSFHATKLFHTIEGGAIVFKYEEDLKKAQLMINFGIDGPDSIKGLGINAKMSEFQAAMGLCVLDDINIIIEARKKLWNRYLNRLSEKIQFQTWRADNNNFGYFPVVFSTEKELLIIKDSLNKKDIFPRRYFYPSLHSVDALNKDYFELNNSDDISKRILCLPLYPGISTRTQSTIIEIINKEVEK